MANPLRRIVFPVSASNVTAITGSIYKVCSNGATGTIHSASFGFINKGTNHLDPAPPKHNLSFDLHYDDNAGDTCIEADFAYVSCSLVAAPNHVHVYIRSHGNNWKANGSGQLA